MSILKSICLLYLLLSCPIAADDWPHWRGPHRNGISSETSWLDQWPKDGPDIAWKAKVGTGFSSFAVASKRVFTMGNDNNTDSVFCFDAETGLRLWQHSYEADLGDNSFEGGTASTPTVDGGHVYTLSRWGDLFCFEAGTGKIVWTKNVQKETNARIPSWGFGGSPLVHEDLLVLNIGEAGMAVEKGTGKIVWQSSSKDAGYSTPFPLQRGGEWLAILASGQSYLAVNLRTGRELWRVRWLTQFGVNAADPIVDGDNIFISTGYGKGAALVKLGGVEPETIWKSKVMRNQINSCVLLGAHLYGIDGDTTDKAALKCVELATGAEKWSQPGIGSGALMAADGKLIVLGDRGELMVAAASPEGFKPTARAQVLGGKCWTVPVLANGRIYCRNSRGDLVCVDVRKRAAE
jgi:outer membrane protein assembly factor BamB